MTDEKLDPIPDGLVVLTFDDGCRSDIDVVAPLLKKVGFGRLNRLIHHLG